MNKGPGKENFTLPCAHDQAAAVPAKIDIEGAFTHIAGTSRALVNQRLLEPTSDVEAVE